MEGGYELSSDEGGGTADGAEECGGEWHGGGEGLR